MSVACKSTSSSVKQPEQTKTGVKNQDVMLKMNPKEPGTISLIEQVDKRKCKKWKVTIFHTRAAVQEKASRTDKTVMSLNN